MLLIFDCDGVVLDSMLLHGEVESEAYGKLGIKISPQELSRRFAGFPQADVSKVLEQETGCKVPPDFDVEKEKIFTQHLKAIPHVSDVLDVLWDVPRCIASGTGVAALKHMLDLVGLYDQFAPHIFSSEMVVRGKPAPDLFLFAAKRMGVEPKDCLVLEDGIAGVQGAKAAGMRVFGFVGGSHCDAKHGDRLKDEGAEIVFSDMRELPSLIDQFSNSKVRSVKSVKL
jgi:HAD superfamily hydrolase (TIGR01509 family)